ncbi:hypothetical protein M0P48_05135 [Candidatus Gracilibacteria bacterium]|nr:hypothetical protein [Candidatus Gracilibacteria bacterium]
MKTSENSYLEGRKPLSSRLPAKIVVGRRPTISTSTRNKIAGMALTGLAALGVSGCGDDYAVDGPAYLVDFDVNNSDGNLGDAFGDGTQINGDTISGDGDSDALDFDDADAVDGSEDATKTDADAEDGDGDVDDADIGKIDLDLIGGDIAEDNIVPDADDDIVPDSDVTDLDADDIQEISEDGDVIIDLEDSDVEEVGDANDAGDDLDANDLQEVGDADDANDSVTDGNISDTPDAGGDLSDITDGNIPDPGADADDAVDDADGIPLPLDIDEIDAVDGGTDAVDGGTDAVDGGTDAVDGGTDAVDSGSDIPPPEPKPCDGKPSGSVKLYYSGDPKTRGQGICEDGIATCNDGTWEVSKPDVTAKPQDLCKGLDDNCDGVKNGQIITYSGPPLTNGVGVCQPQIEGCFEGGYVVDQKEV